MGKHGEIVDRDDGHDVNGFGAAGRCLGLRTEV